MDLLPGYINSSLHSFLWVISCLGLGSFINRWLKNATRLEIILINFLIGCLVWITLALVLSAFHAFKPELIKLLVYFAGFGSILIFGKTWWKWLREGNKFDLKILTLAIILFIHGLYALAPVISFDATCYHLPLTTDILDHGSIIYTPFIFNSAFPKNFELLQAIGLAIGGDASASLVSWWFSIGTVLVLIALGNRINKPSLGYWAAIAICLTPLWFELARTPNNEVGMALGITLLALAIVMRAPGWVVGAAIGWMGGCKYYGFEIGGIAFIAWILQNRPGWRSVLLSMGVIILAAGFWYARNACLFANPIFPYYHDFFKALGTARITDSTAYVWDVYGQFDQFASPTTFKGWLTAPFRLIAHPSPDFIEGGNTAWKWVGLLASVWPLAVIPIVKRQKKLIGPFLTILIGTILWITLHGIIYLRFLTPLLVLMYFFSFLVISDWLSCLKIKPVTRSIGTFIICLLAIIHLAGPTTTFSLLNLPLNSEERDIFLERTFCGWPVIRELNQIDPAPTVYYLYGENSRHYCEFPLYSGWRDPYGFGIFHDHASSGAELAAWLEEIGVDVLMVNYGRGVLATGEIIDALSDEDFTNVYNTKILMYYSTSVFVHRDVDIDFFLEPEDGGADDSATLYYPADSPAG